MTRTLIAFAAASVGLVLAAPLVLVLLPFWVVSALTRLLAQWLEPAFLTRDQMIEHDPKFGWKMRPNLSTHHLVVDLFHIRTDSQGWRGRWALDESELVVFGDSFAAGYGVGEKHFYANLLKQPRIKPIGTGGYSLVQEFLWMREMAPALSGKLVVWFIYYGNDLYDNLSPDLRGYRKPFLREKDGDWEIVSHHVTADAWPIVTKQRLEGAHHLPKLAEFCGPGFHSDRAYRACEFLIREGEQLCAESGSTLVVLGIPDVYQLSPEGHRYLLSLGGNPKVFDPDYPDRQIEAICRRVGVQFVPGSRFLDPTCYKTNDCHWNPKGHRRVAEELRKIYASAPPRRGRQPKDALSPVGTGR